VARDETSEEVAKRRRCGANRMQGNAWHAAIRVTCETAAPPMSSAQPVQDAAALVNRIRHFEVLAPLKDLP